MEQIKVIESPKGTYKCEIGVSVEEWESILTNSSVTTPNYKDALMAFYNQIGHKASCKELGLKYYGNAKDAQKFNSWISKFGQAVVKELNRFQIIDEDGSERFWHVSMCMGTYDSKGLFVTTLRPEIVKAIENIGWVKHSTWIPFYIEMADKLLSYKNNRKALLELVYELDKKYVGYIKTDDGGHTPDIDPFTVFGIFNRGLSNEKRIKLCKYFKEKLSIEADIPSDFDGIPVVNNLRATFFWREFVETDIQPLWDLFEAALGIDDASITKYFDIVCKQQGIKWNITMGLYWICPYDFISLDSRNRDYLQSLGFEIFKDYQINSAHYFPLIQKIKDKIAAHEIVEKDFPEISYQAWVKDFKETTKRDYWLVGYSFGSTHSQLERFLKDSIWEGGFEDESESDQNLMALAKTIKVGDVLILKSTSTKGSKHDQPFLRVKAVAVVTSGIKTKKVDNTTFCSCEVKYYGIKDHDFDDAVLGSYRKTIHLADSKAKPVVDYANQLLNEEPMPQKKYQEYIDLLQESYNLVITGSPGTGKTYMAQAIADEMGAETMFVQFHPSFDYTDFVEGLRPVEKNDGQIGFERKDGVFKEFCREAIKAMKQKVSVLEANKEERKPYVFIIDEINRGEASKIFGELFYAIDPGYRGKTDHLVQTQYQNLVPETDVFAKGFYVPENVYILATMNDIDRSVESMDFAMRRRFTWKEVTPADTESMLDTLDCSDEAKATMKRLNNAIAETDGLGAAYQIGPSYFLKLSENGGDFNKLWKMNIEPLLKEYMRGFRKASDTLDKFHKAYFNKKEESGNDALELIDED